MRTIRNLSLIALLAFLSTTYVMAEDNGEVKEKIVTSSWSLISADAVVANHYLSDQQHSGSMMGLGMKFGSMYKKSENLSWDIDINYMMAPYVAILPDASLSNAAKTSFYSMHTFDADYGTYYNWNPVKNLYIKAGGCFDFLFGFTGANPEYVNNSIDVDLQAQFKAAAGIRYGWQFKKIGLFLQADVAVPFMGMALCGNSYQSGFESLLPSEILQTSVRTMHLTSFHNLTGYNAEFELDLEFRHTTLFMTIEFNNRWWNMNNLQNYRLYTISKTGIKVDLVSRSRRDSKNRYF